MGNKPSIVSMARGGMYVATLALPLKTAYDQFIGIGMSPSEAATHAVKAMGGIDYETNTFSMDVLKQMYTPIVAWTIIDTIASKFGVWRRMGRLIGNLNLLG